MSDKLHKLRAALLRDDLYENSNFRELLRDPHPSEIYSEENGFRLFLGSAEHASDLPSLEERRITCILNMAAGESSCQMTPEVYGDGYRVMRIAAEDLEEYDISPHILPALDFILEARRRGEGILVHCVAGASRSSTVVIAYFMIHHQWKLEKAVQYVRSHRQRVFPNIGFFGYLVKLEKQETK